MTVPDERAGKDEKLLFPGYASSCFGHHVKRVANLNISKSRSMLESEMERKIVEDDVPKDILLKNGNNGLGPP